MTDLLITHTPAEGTLIDGTAKGDGSGEILKRYRWRWGRSIGSWFIPRSRDVAPKRGVIEATAAALRDAGFTVGLDIDDSHRPAAEVEADKAARAEDRAAALAEKAQRKQAKAEAAEQAARTAVETLPDGGEPVKIGHHSEGRHRRDINRAHTAMGRSVEANREADRAASAAETAAAATAGRYAVSTVANRIERIEAEARGVERQLNGHTTERGTVYQREVPPATGAARERLTVEAERLADELAYWRGVRDEQIATGQATTYSREDISAGDAVQVNRGSWWQVKRANTKTVTLIAGGCQIRAPYAHITAHRTAEWLNAHQAGQAGQAEASAAGEGVSQGG